MTNSLTPGACALGALAGLALLTGCAHQSPLMSTPVPIGATITSNGSGYSWVFSGAPAYVQPSTGDLDFSQITGEIDVTITLSGSLNPHFDATDGTALKAYDPDSVDSTCELKPDQPNDHGWQFGRPRIDANGTVMTFHYNHKKNDPHGQPMLCNSYGLGAVIGSTVVSKDPMVHN